MIKSAEGLCLVQIPTKLLMTGYMVGEANPHRYWTMPNSLISKQQIQPIFDFVLNSTESYPAERYMYQFTRDNDLCTLVYCLNNPYRLAFHENLFKIQF